MGWVNKPRGHGMPMRRIVKRRRGPRQSMAIRPIPDRTADRDPSASRPRARVCKLAHQHPDCARSARFGEADARRANRCALMTDVMCALNNSTVRPGEAAQHRRVRSGSQRDRLLQPACDAGICAAPSGQARLIPSRAQLWPTRTPSPPASPVGRSRGTPS